MTTTPAPPPDGTAARAVALDAALWRLGTGPLADLRRMEPDLPTGHFWWMMETTGGSDMAPERLRQWAELVRMLALFVPRGDPDRRAAPQRRVPLGEALADGAPQPREGWSPDRDDEGRPVPVFAELRLSQLLTARGRGRAEALRRACAFLAPRMGQGVGIRAADLAGALFQPDRPEILARPYYRRLAQGKTRQTKEDAS